MKEKHISLKLKVLFILFLIQTVAVTGQDWEWAEQFSGDGSVTTVDVVTDNSDNVYIVGIYSGPSVSIGTDVLLNLGDDDVFICSFDASGNFRWSDRIAGIGKDDVQGIDIDESDNIYVVGGFQDETIYFSPSDSLENFNHFDSYLVKYDNLGNFIYGKRLFWGSNQQRIQNIVVDISNGLLAMVGTFKNELIYFDGVSEQTIPVVGPKDVFLTTYNYNGNFQKINTFSTTQQQTTLKNIDVCAPGGYFISGSFRETINFSVTESITGDAVNMDAVVIRVDDNLNYLWARKGGGTGYDHINSAGADKFGNVYLTGKCESTIKFDSTATQQTGNITGFGGIDMFIAKYNRSGNLKWINRNGYTGNDNAYGLAIFQNLVQFAGIYTDQLIVNQDTLKCEVVGDLNTSFAIYDTDGNPVGAQQVSGDLEEQGSGVAFNSNGHTYILGYSASPIIKFGTLTLINSSSPNYDGFLANYIYPFSPRFTKIQHISCHGGNDGELIVTPQFGAGPYTYSWSHDAGLTDSTATNLTTGDYTCTVTATGSAETVPLSMTITEPAAISISDVITDVSCHPENGAGNDGTIDIEVTGGIPGYIYSWTTLDGSGVEATDEDQFTLTAGTYYVEVTDDNGCVKQDTFLVSQPQQIFFNGTKTDITVPPGSNGVIDLSTTGGTPPYGFAWTGPKSFTASTEDLAGLVNAGTYVLNLTDDHTCTADTNITVLVDTMLIAYVCDLQDVQCHGESNGYATVCVENGSGDYNYYWTNSIGGHVGGNNATLSNMPSGTYYCEVTDNVSLKKAEINPPAIIEEPDAELTLIFDPQDLLCNDDNSGSIDLTISGGTLPYSFSWTGPNGFTSTSEDVDNLEAGLYSCIVTDANGCTTSLLNYEIEEPPVIGVNPIPTDVLCYGELTGKAKANASGGTGSLSYLWDDPAAQTDETAEFLETGTYHVTVTDANGCQETGTAFVDQPASPLTLSEVHLDVSCNGGADGTIAVSASGGTSPYPSILWDDFAITWTRGALPADTYGATVTDANNCQEYISVEITEPPAIVIDDVAYTDVTGCPGDANGTVTVSAHGGTPSLQYSIDGGTNWQVDNLFTGMVAGTYDIAVKDANDCEEAGSPVIIVDPEGVEIDLISFTHASCSEVDNGTITVIASGGTRPYQYSIDCGTTWQTDSLFTGLAPDTYNVQVMDATPCLTACNPVTISAGTGVQIDDVQGTTNCAIEILASGGTTPYEYSIDGGSTFVTANIFSFADGLTNGNYDIMVRDADLCEDSRSSVAVSGCPDSLQCEIYEAFTPNDDGVNDVWNLHCQDEYPNIQVRIFNTWGNLVFESAVGYPEPWDGMGKNGKELPAGTYFYVIDWGDGTDPSSGTVNIIK